MAHVLAWIQHCSGCTALIVALYFVKYQLKTTFSLSAARSIALELSTGNIELVAHEKNLVDACWTEVGLASPDSLDQFVNVHVLFAGPAHFTV